MIFYDCKTAPSPRRARLFIAEKGIEVETREVALGEGAHLALEFRAINPHATVPVLVTDEGAVLTENLGIAAYLEAKFPARPLMGETPDEKGLVLMWNAIMEQQGGAPIADALRNSSPRMEGRAIVGPVNFQQIPELAERGRVRVGLFFDLLENRLSEAPYLAGERFTLPDISALVFVEFARAIRMTVPDEHPATLDWYARVKERPSASL
ncbi:glutathione S-transferase [Ruegeria sp. 2012CJ41-6]|uniref:Glutathione S-transferase n=1 Tax=Ruegeria spongiae TaxID=2942209 RepID=A0ABT0Q016_9RHOB|nr:glutathione S-transferase [Ruegeria spongiae]MCL6282523.1 glutathione S-transferase [Ruegeria spongiae]